jgi:fatty-acyl-CoA synthase
MAHPAVSQACVIAIPHEKWDERPLAAIVLREGESATEDELHSHLEVDFARFWLPDAYEFVEAIPMTATGKFQKLKLREQFEGYTSPKS